MASDWANSHGYADLEGRIGSGKATKDDIALMGQISSVDPSAGAQAMWNDFVARIQDQEQGGGFLGIKELRGSGLPNTHISELSGLAKTARDLTGNSLGIPGADPALYKGDWGNLSPVTKGAAVAAAVTLGGPALFGGSGGGLTATEGANSITSFVNGGEWDAAMGEMMGVPSTADATLLESSLSAAAPAAGGATAAVDTLAASGGTPGVGDAGAFDQFGARSFPDNGTNATVFDGGGGGAGGGGGIINNAINFAKGNPLLTLAGAQLGAGVLSGVGNYLTQNELMDKKVQADKELMAQSTAEQEKLADWRRRFTQGGSYFDAKMPFTPKPGATLRRSDGTPVYKGGIINNTQGGG